MLQKILGNEVSRIAEGDEGMPGPGGRPSNDANSEPRKTCRDSMLLS
jgi:hypothetical protein